MTKETIILETLSPPLSAQATGLRNRAVDSAQWSALTSLGPLLLCFVHVLHPTGRVLSCWWCWWGEGSPLTSDTRTVPWTRAMPERTQFSSWASSSRKEFGILPKHSYYGFLKKWLFLGILVLFPSSLLTAVTQNLLVLFSCGSYVAGNTSWTLCYLAYWREGHLINFINGYYANAWCFQRLNKVEFGSLELEWHLYII